MFVTELVGRLTRVTDAARLWLKQVTLAEFSLAKPARDRSTSFGFRTAAERRESTVVLLRSMQSKVIKQISE